MNDLRKKLKDMVVMFVADEDELEETMIDDKITEVCGLPTFSSMSPDEIEEVRASIKSEFSIKLDRGVLIEEKNHEKWFLARKAQLDMKYWERYKKYLCADKGFSTKVVNTMDDILDTLTDLLGDPKRDIRYKRRGLIIGDVQSGKTANYTGLICKAVDSGYKVVVLLTGMIEKLRQQTQKRIDEGFVGRDSDALMKKQEDKIVIGVGKYDSSISPVCLTSTSDDFKQKNASNLNFDLRNINGSVIFVVKKNSAVLKRLNKWLKTFNQSGDNAIDNSLLVIDDEADNASVNTNVNESPTAINGQIRELLKNFTKSSYVGFTASPFANIFIDPDSYDEMVEEDLFPKDYIYSLNAPSNYIGARNIFVEASGMLVEINDDVMDPASIGAILPLKHKPQIRVNCIPEDMKDAIATFILANVIQDIDIVRKRENTHRSMLINVSRVIAVQNQVSELVNEYLKNMQSSCRVYGKLPEDRALEDEYIRKLKNVYEEIYQNVGIKWSVIQDNLHSACAGITVMTINSKSGNNLDFSTYKDGLRVIAVGGMSLSRGLTLEGLVVSYFYRNSTMYDTLMQMGRWFGYRTGYDDLCRIWMSEESIEWYRHISAATDELRDEVKRYEDSDLTPKDFGLRVRSDITTLLVTSRNKMRSAESRECVISLSGETIETPEILADTEKNEANFCAVKELIDSVKREKIVLECEDKRGNKRYGFRNVPELYILELLEKIKISPKNEEFNTAVMSKFIRDYQGKELKRWDIVFATGDSEDVIDVLGTGCEFHHPIRKFSIENDGKILKMSGSKRRLGTTLDGRFGISEEGKKKAVETAMKRARRRAETTGRPMPEKINLRQSDYFAYGIERNPLLVIYYIGLG